MRPVLSVSQFCKMIFHSLTVRWVLRNVVVVSLAYRSLHEKSRETECIDPRVNYSSVSILELDTFVIAIFYMFILKIGIQCFHNHFNLNIGLGMVGRYLKKKILSKFHIRLPFYDQIVNSKCEEFFSEQQWIKSQVRIKSNCSQQLGRFFHILDVRWNRKN